VYEHAQVNKRTLINEQLMNDQLTNKCTNVRTLTNEHKRTLNEQNTNS